MAIIPFIMVLGLVGCRYLMKGGRDGLPVSLSVMLSIINKNTHHDTDHHLSGSVLKELSFSFMIALSLVGCPTCILCWNA
jgi:hypothetical protein